MVNELEQLHKAAGKGNIKVVFALLEKGIKVDAVLNYGERIALHEASESGHLEVVKLLLEKGAKIDHKRGHGSTPEEVIKFSSNSKNEKSKFK